MRVSLGFVERRKILNCLKIKAADLALETGRCFYKEMFCLFFYFCIIIILIRMVLWYCCPKERWCRLNDDSCYVRILSIAESFIQSYSNSNHIVNQLQQYILYLHSSYHYHPTVSIGFLRIPNIINLSTLICGANRKSAKILLLYKLI